MNARISDQYLARVYARAHENTNGDAYDKHLAGLREVARCSQPGHLPPASETVRPAEEPDTL